MDSITIKNVENELSGMFDNLDLKTVNKMIKKVELASKKDDLAQLERRYGPNDRQVRQLKQNKKKAKNEIDSLIASMNTLKVVPSAKQKRSALLKALRQKKMKSFNKFVSKSLKKPSYSKTDLFEQMQSIKDEELDDIMDQELDMQQYDDFGIGDLKIGGKKRKRTTKSKKKRSIKKKRGGAKKSIKKKIGGKKRKPIKKKFIKKKSIKKKRSIKKYKRKIGGKKRGRKSKK